MSYCSNCGAQLRGDVVFCPECGTRVAGAQQPGGAAGQRHGFWQQRQQQQQYFDPADVADNRILAVFCYLGLFLLIPLLLKPDSAFVKYHANQGLALLLLSIASALVCIIPFLGRVVGGLGLLFCLICLLIGAVNCLGGQAKPLPVIGVYTILR